MARSLRIGEIILVDLPSNQPPGREQEGRRPAIVVGLPTEPIRYPILLIAPMTTAIGNWVDSNSLMYPKLMIGTAGLTKNSVVLLDQIRSLDPHRLVTYFGSLTNEQYQPVSEGIKALLRVQ